MNATRCAAEKQLMRAKKVLEILQKGRMRFTPLYRECRNDLTMTTYQSTLRFLEDNGYITRERKEPRETWIGITEKGVALYRVL